MRIASFNVENLFARPNAFRSTDLSVAEPMLDAYGEVNALRKVGECVAQDERARKHALRCDPVRHVDDLDLRRDALDVAVTVTEQFFDRKLKPTGFFLEQLAANLDRFSSLLIGHPVTHSIART